MKRLILLAQPGAMFEKHAPDSPWMTDPDAGRVGRAVVKRRLPKGVIKTTEGNFKEHTKMENGAIVERQLIPLKASDQRNVAGYKAVKYRQMKESAGGEKVRKVEVGTDAALNKEITNVRNAMAGELRAKHNAILAIKKEIGGQPRRGNIIPMVERPQIEPRHVSEVQARLKTKTEAVISQRMKRAGQLQKALESATAKGIAREQAKKSTEPLKKDTLRSKVHNALEPMRKEVIPSASEKEASYGHLSNYTGKSVERLARIRSKLDAARAFQTPGGGIDPNKAPGYRKKIEKKLLDNGSLFRSGGVKVPKAAAPPAHSGYPALRKLGIGTAIAAGVVGTAGLIASRRKDRQPVQMSAKTDQIIQLARGYVYENAMREFITPATRQKIATRTVAARARSHPKMGIVQRRMAGEHQAEFVEQARAAGNKNTLTQERHQAAIDLVKARAIKGTRRKVATEMADKDAEIAKLTEHKENFKKRAERLEKPHLSSEAARKEGYDEGYEHGRDTAQREFVDTTRTKREDFNTRVKKESDYHSQRAQQTIRKAKAGMNKKLILTGGAGVTTGVVAGRQTKKEKEMQFSDNTRRDVIRGAANMGASAGVTGAATGLVLGLAGRRSSLGRAKIGLLPKLVVAGRSAGKIGAVTGAAGLASAAVGTSILGAPKRNEGAAYTKRGALGGAIIGAAGGAAVGALALKHGGIRKFVGKHAKDWAPLNTLLKSGTGKRVAIGSGVGAAAGAAQMADEGQQVDTINSTKRKPLIRFASKDDKLHDVMTGAVEGGAGVLATDPLIHRIQTGEWKNPFKESARAVGKKVLIGAGVGAVATGAIGALIHKMKAKAAQDQSGQVQNFAVKQSVAADRYRKSNENEDLNRRDANLARSAIAGGALGAVLKKAGGTTKTRALIGAGAGAASVLGIRSVTHKDQFNDRSHTAKVAEGLPWKVAAAGAGLTAISKIRGKLGTIKFASKWDIDSDKFNARRRSEDVSQYVRRGHGLIKDFTGGKFDERGRPRKREIDKPWVRNLATTAIITGSLAAAHKARKFVGREAEREVAANGTGGAFSKLNEAVRSGNATKAFVNMPGIRHVMSAVKSVGKFAGDVRREAAEATREQADKLATKINESAAGPGTRRPAPAATRTNKDGSITHMPAGSPAAEKADTKKRNAIRGKIGKIARGEATELQAILDHVTELAEFVDDWDIRDPRGRSARVYAPGSQRRQRRGKYWHEKKDNRELLHKAELGGALVAGVLLAKGKRKVAPIATKTEAKVAEGGVDEFIQRNKRMVNLSARLDLLLS